MFSFRPSELASSEEAISPVAVVDTYEFKDYSNRSLSDGHRKSGDQNLTIDSAYHFPSRFQLVKPVYIEQFVEGGMWAVKASKGKALGFQAVDDDHTISLTMNSVPSGSTYILDVIGHSYSVLYVFSDGSVNKEETS